LYAHPTCPRKSTKQSHLTRFERDSSTPGSIVYCLQELKPIGGVV